MSETNPKMVQAMKEGKVRVETMPFEVLLDDAIVHALGADKYGERNWRKSRIKASTYEGAIMRHFIAWASGEDIDSESGVSHLNHIRACCAVVLDSAKHDTLIDDRKRAEVKGAIKAGEVVYVKDGESFDEAIQRRLDHD